MSNDKLNSSIVRVEMSNEELNNAIARADAELDMLKDSCHDLYDRNKELEDKYIKALEVAQERFEIIQKAIEYIEHYGNLYCLRHKQFKEYKQYEDLLDILKGSNKDIPGFEGTLEELDNLSIRGK